MSANTCCAMDQRVLSRSLAIDQAQVRLAFLNKSKIRFVWYSNVLCVVPLTALLQNHNYVFLRDMGGTHTHSISSSLQVLQNVLLEHYICRLFAKFQSSKLSSCLSPITTFQHPQISKVLFCHYSNMIQQNTD